MTAAELLALAERVEGLTEADRKVDGDVAFLFGLPQSHFASVGIAFDRVDGPACFYGDATWAGGGDSWHAPRLTSSLDAVVSLIEQVLPGAEWTLKSRSRTEHSWALICRSDEILADAEASAECRALLSAILRAKAAEVAG